MQVTTSANKQFVSKKVSEVLTQSSSHQSEKVVLLLISVHFFRLWCTWRNAGEICTVFDIQSFWFSLWSGV